LKLTFSTTLGGNMKDVHILFIFFLTLLFQQIGLTQIPNGSFENWTGGNPDGWTTNNIIGYLELVTQSNDAHSGNSSARMEMMYAMSALMQPVLNAGPLLVGIPVSERHTTISFYYKFTPTTSTVYFLIVVGMYKSGSYIGGGAGSTKNSTTSYTKFTSTISYLNQNVPDMANIYVTLIDSFYNPQSVGSIALIDDIYFDQANDINDQDNFPVEYSLWQNYPNPFNPSTVINYQLPVGGDVTLKIYDLLGREVATLVDEYKPAGRYAIEWNAGYYPSGVYLYQLNTVQLVAMKKMILIK
jgi:hypothetical protein